MRRTSLLIAAMLVGTSAQAAELVVEISGVRSAKGTVRAALYDGADGFPGRRKPAAGSQGKAKPGTVLVIFRNVKPGRYALAAFHDENGNKKLDTTGLGLPKEGLGFSKKGASMFGPPSFSRAAFTIGPSKTRITLKIKY